MSNTEKAVNIFEQAARIKLRFDTPRGKLSAEDLWDLPLTHNNPNHLSLDALAVELDALVKGTGNSFVNNPKKDNILQLQFDIAKYIIDVRVAEKAAKTDEQKKKTEIDKIDRLIEQRKDNDLASLTVEELEAKKAALQ